MDQFDAVCFVFENSACFSKFMKGKEVTCLVSRTDSDPRKLAVITVVVNVSSEFNRRRQREHHKSTT